MIQVQQNEIPKFKCVPKEEQDKLKIEHKCINNEIMVLPKYLYISPSYPKDYTVQGYKRIKNNTAELRCCPICSKPINFK